MKQQPVKSNAKRKSGAGMMVISIIAAAIVVASVVFLWIFRISDSSNADRKALLIGEEAYSVAQMNFFYFSALDELLQNANGSVDMLGLDVTKDLSKQACPLSESGESWKAYLIRQAEESLTKVDVLCTEAKNSDAALDSVAQSEIDSELEYYQFLGQKAGYEDFAAYLKHTYGAGFSEKILRGLLEKIYLADQFEQTTRASFTFTDEQLSDFYRQNEYLYQRYTYLFAFVNGSEETDSICSALSAANTPEAFEETTLELTGQECYHMQAVKGSELGDHTSADVAWLTAAQRCAGDTFIGKTEAAAYVLYFIEKSDNGFSEGTDDGWKAEANSALQEETYQAWLSEATAGYAVKEYRALEKTGSR